jgi:hypothetical protein
MRRCWRARPGGAERARRVAQLCRASGHTEAAGTAALEALARGVPGAALERARLLWAREQQHAAIVRLQEARRPPRLNTVRGGLRAMAQV